MKRRTYLTKKALAFDMDGTLYSSEPLLEKVYAIGIEQYNQEKGTNFKAPLFSELEPLIGQPVKKIYQTLFPGITPEEMAHLGGILREEFQRHIAQYGGRLFEGVRETLSDLKEQGYVILIASNGIREYIQSIVDKFGLDVEDFVCVEEKGIRSKGEILKYYLNHYGLGADEIVMIGDRSSDIEAAREVGCTFVGCHFGHGNAEEIEEADFIIYELAQIFSVLRDLGGDRVA
jgi:phosphoglycolate phosphatase